MGSHDPVYNFNWFDWALTAAGGTTTPTSAINNLVYAVNAANNRLVVPAGQSGVLEYDAAGNQTRDTFTQSGVARYSYDAENRLKTVQNDTLTITYATYTYDGDGKRVKRLASGVETWQVYGLGGELLAEYAASGAAGSPQKEYGYRNGQLLVTAAGSTVTWLMPDQLGSTRLEIAASGAWNAVTRHDYLPFGEELGANVGVRGNAGSGYATSSIRQRFTGKERDGETGLDYFLARQYSNLQGRFISPDEFKGGAIESGILGSGHPEKQALFYADTTDPQTLNKYQYCLNSPLRYVDQDGQKPQDGGIGRAEERDVRDLAAGKITKEEFQKRQQERADPRLLVGAAAVAAAYFAPEVFAYLGLWASRNPQTAQRMAEEAVQMSSGNPMPAPGKLSFPSSGNNRELLGQIMSQVLPSKGNGVAKAALFEALAAEAKQITGGGWEAVKVATNDGAYLYMGRGPHIVVITQAGKILRGANKAVTLLKNGLVKIDYKQLEEVK